MLRKMSLLYAAQLAAARTFSYCWNYMHDGASWYRRTRTGRLLTTLASSNITTIYFTDDNIHMEGHACLDCQTGRRTTYMSAQIARLFRLSYSFLPRQEKETDRWTAGAI